MPKRHSSLFLVIAFIFAQIAWLGLLGMWIYWYVSNYIILQQVGDKLSPQITMDSNNVLVFVGGIILIVGLAFILTLIFRNFTVQLRITKLYDNFIANITHELKSPLSSIQLYLETLKSKSVPKEKQAEFIGMMIKDSERLQKLINSILEISQLESKRISHDYRVYNADEIFPKMIESSRDQCRLSESEVTFEGRTDCRCVLDKNAMQIVFDNLVDNAVKFSMGKPFIKVNIFRVQSKIFILFCDRGIGIDAQDQKKIFQKFQRIYNNTIPNVKGTGLGLYWVREILKQHGGKISVSSDGLNKGSCFKIELPVYYPSRKDRIHSLLKKAALNKNKNGSENGNE